MGLSGAGCDCGNGLHETVSVVQILPGRSKLVLVKIYATPGSLQFIPLCFKGLVGPICRSLWVQLKSE